MTAPFDCIPLNFWRLMWPICLCHNSISVLTLRTFTYMADFTSFKLRMNIRLSLRPRAMNCTSSSMKHPPRFGWIELASLAPSFARPTPSFWWWWVHARHFFMYVLLPSLLNETLLTCRMGCVVSSLVSIKLGQSSVRKSQYHSPWDIMWFEAPESTNHISSKLEVLVGPEADIEFSLCLITNIPPYSSNSESVA